MQVLSDLIAWATQAAANRPVLASAYFTALQENMSRETFARTQRQFYFAVRFFSRPMAALAARMPDSASRHGLIHNLAEEHGAGAGLNSPALLNPQLAHDRTFLRFLSTLGVDLETMKTSREGPAVRAFNAAVMGVSLMEPRALAFACLGIIEHTFAGISARIGETVVRRGWIAENALVHYKLHAEIDERHAADLFAMAVESWRSGAPGRAQVEDGVFLGLHIFRRLYDDLLEEAATGIDP